MDRTLWYLVQFDNKNSLASFGAVVEEDVIADKARVRRGDEVLVIFENTGIARNAKVLEISGNKEFIHEIKSQMTIGTERLKKMFFACMNSNLKTIPYINIDESLFKSSEKSKIDRSYGGGSSQEDVRKEHPEKLTFEAGERKYSVPDRIIKEHLKEILKPANLVNMWSHLSQEYKNMDKKQTMLYKTLFAEQI